MTKTYLHSIVLAAAVAASIPSLLHPTTVLAADPPALAAPAQDQGLPYTRSARPTALAKIKDQIAVFAGSRYAYVNGYKVRLDDANLRSEAVLREGVVYVPQSFISVLDLKQIQVDKAPDYLANRWVYTIQRPAAAAWGGRGLQIDGQLFVPLADAAKQAGLKVYQNARGLVLMGQTEASFADSDAVLMDSVITMFDTPEKFADPDIATKYIPTLQRQGKWTDHVKTTPEQLKLLAQPEPNWPLTPTSEYDYRGFNATLLGSKVPAPGVYPRLLFSPDDIPMLQQHIKQNKLSQMSMIEVEELFKKSWWDPKTSDGQVFQKLIAGDFSGLGVNLDTIRSAPGNFPGQKPGIYSTHINYNANCLTTMALYCLLTNDDVRGKQVATAISNFYRIVEPAVDRHLATSDSEFGVDFDNANNGQTQWRGMHGVVPHMDIAFSLDFAGKWMTAEQKDDMRRLIAKATYGRRTNGGDGPRRNWRDINHVTWHLTHFLAVASIEGLEGFDREAYASGAELARDFVEWGLDKDGLMFESNGKSGGGIQFQVLSMIAMARRGENLWGHPHWRKLAQAQVFVTAPNGKATLSSGTWGGSPFVFQSLNEFKAFYPGDKSADYLLTQGEPTLDLATVDLEKYREKVRKEARLRLPGPTYPGLRTGLLYDTDWAQTARTDLKLPLNWESPVSGVLSTASDTTDQAAWLCLYTRANHYMGSGHHHADLGMFYFSGAGVNWFTESPFPKTYTGKYHNQVLIDGISEPDGSPARCTYLGAVAQPAGAMATADLTYAYSWKWCCQVQLWDKAWIGSGSLLDVKWELETDPQNLLYFQGTERYKMRIWWPSYTFSNWTPNLRAPFNPVKYAYRTAGLVRGNHSYGLVVDDVKKDDQTRLYQWTAMLGKNVWRADVAGLGANQTVLGYREPALKQKSGPVARLAITPAAGDPMLLVCALDPVGSVQSAKVETALDGPDEGKGPQKYDRVAIDLRAAESKYRVALIPFRYGESLPKVVYDSAANTASIQWKDQTDQITFVAGDDNRTRVRVMREGKQVLESK